MLVEKLNDVHSVDIIIPISIREEYDIFERIMWRKNIVLPSNFKFLFIIYDTKPNINILENFLEDLNFKYLSIDSKVGPFNLAKARNLGLKKTESSFVLFEDIDLINHVDFYHWLDRELVLQLKDKRLPFIVLPVLYLNKNYKTGNGILNDNEYYRIVNENLDVNSDVVEFYAPVSSYILCETYEAKVAGGFDEMFEGWGLEDSDFILKMLKNSKIEKPTDFYRYVTKDYKDQVHWQGWKSLFRILGNIMENKGIYSFHIWHDKASYRSDNHKQRNLKIFSDNTLYYKNIKHALIPLNDQDKPYQIFLSTNPFSFNKQIFKLFDNPYLVLEHEISESNISDIFNSLNFDKVIFNNPYANEKRLYIYNYLNSIGANTIVIERGALPYSVYIDDSGFCCESKMYSENLWNKGDLNFDQLKSVQSYISTLKYEVDTLEKQQSILKGALNLKRDLNLDNKKIIFIPFQSQSDTTVRYFCDQVGSYDNFVEEIKRLANILPPNWAVVYKNHPLSKIKIDILNAHCLDQYHINDILAACDCVALINSGVGVLAAIFEKPVFYFGKAFYGISGFNYKVSTADEILFKLDELSFDSAKMYKFIYYLVNEFYSFAEWKTYMRSISKDANETYTYDINYNQIRYNGIFLNFVHKYINFSNHHLFDRVRLDAYLQKKPTTKQIKSEHKGSDENVNLMSKHEMRNQLILPSKNSLQIPHNSNVLFNTIRRVGESKKIIQIVNKTRNRKLKKLLKNPEAFFNDMILNLTK